MQHGNQEVAEQQLSFPQNATDSPISWLNELKKG